MPCPTSRQKKAIKAYEAKVHKHSANNSEAENSNDIGNLSVCDEPIENNNAENIVKKLQDAVNKYYQEHHSNQTRRLRYLGNSVCTKRRKRQQQFNEEQLENEDQLEEVNEDEKNIGGLLEDEIEACNLLKKILAALENLALDIEKENEKLRSTSYFHEGIRYDQNMIFPSDYRILELCGKAKGLKEVLRERGLWPEKELKLKGARELMSQQPDFLAQKGQLEEII
ncbi:35402_t:CDS:2, partial [Gigaspora margarita]